MQPQLTRVRGTAVVFETPRRASTVGRVASSRDGDSGRRCLDSAPGFAALQEKPTDWLLALQVLVPGRPHGSPAAPSTPTQTLAAKLSLHVASAVCLEAGAACHTSRASVRATSDPALASGDAHGANAEGAKSDSDDCFAVPALQPSAEIRPTSGRLAD